MRPPFALLLLLVSPPHAASFAGVACPLGGHCAALRRVTLRAEEHAAASPLEARATALWAMLAPAAGHLGEAEHVDLRLALRVLLSKAAIVSSVEGTARQQSALVGGALPSTLLEPTFRTPPDIATDGGSQGWEGLLSIAPAGDRAADGWHAEAPLVERGGDAAALLVLASVRAALDLLQLGLDAETVAVHSPHTLSRCSPTARHSPLANRPHRSRAAPHSAAPRAGGEALGQRQVHVTNVDQAVMLSGSALSAAAPSWPLGAPSPFSARVDHLLEQAEIRGDVGRSRGWSTTCSSRRRCGTTSRLNHFQTRAQTTITVDLPLEQARRLQAMPASLLPRPASLDDLD